MPRFGQTKDVVKRIEAKTIYDGDCFRFTGKKARRNYGSIWYKGRMVRIGRLICHLYHNADLKDHNWVASHIDECKHHDCWNPFHLKVATQQEKVNGVKNRKVEW